MIKLFAATRKFFIKSRWRIVVLLIVVLTGAAYFLPGNRQKPPPNTSQGATPTPRALTPQEQTAFAQNKARLISQLPYRGDLFTVQYFPDQDYFFIQIQKQPYKVNKLEAEAWLKQNGVDPSYVNVEWGAVRGAGPSQ